MSKLGPLPGFAPEFRPRWPGDKGGFTAKQMRSYAQQEVEKGRERWESNRAELVAAWNDLPDDLRCHPGLKRLYRAAQRV